MTSIDLSTFRNCEEQGLLTCRAHPTGQLLIWNYTQRCQYEQVWNDITTQARGLITTPDGKIIARPFRKFFNLEQHQGDLPLEPFTVTTKMDGSLGILFWLDGVPQIATRGSFTSEQAVKATAILHEKYDSTIGVLNPHYTYLFEVIYPSNRIVVDYGNMEDLVLLAVIHTETGQEIDIHESNMLKTFRGTFPFVKRYDGINDIAQLRILEEENAEGFVIRFASGLRLKLKFAEYLRLHRLMTHVNARVIWDLLRDGQPLDELLERVPDEFYNWIRRTQGDLLAQFQTIERHCQAIVNQIKDLPTRKEQAAIVLKTRYPGITFTMLDQKNYQEAIWKLLYPEAARPFKIEDDA